MGTKDTKSLTREEDHLLTQILGGEEVVRAIIAANNDSTIQLPKFGSWTRGQVEGLITKLGEDVARRIASGELVAEVKDGNVVVEKSVLPLFDKGGRGIPFPGMKGVVDANRSFNLGGPFEVNYKLVHNRLKKHFGRKYKFMPVSEFETRCKTVLDFVRNNPRIANLLNGPYFPWVMPQLSGDIGKLLDNVIVPAAESSYKEQFAGREFTNYRHKDLAGKVTVIPDTRQDTLIRAMDEDSICGVYFPTLQGFGIPADREWIMKVSEQRLILSGMEVPVVVAAYPDICGRDHQTPGLDMAALQWQSSDYSLCFFAGDDGADFGRRSLGTSGSSAGGVSILG